MLRHPDIRIGLILFAVFAALFGYTFTLPRPRLSVGVGPAFVPQIVLVALLGLTLALLIQGAVRARGQPPPGKEKSAGRRHVHGMLLAVAFALVMDYVGTYVAITLFVVCAMFLAGGRRPWTIAALAVLLPAFIYAIFTFFLEIQFPAEWAF